MTDCIQIQSYISLIYNYVAVCKFCVVYVCFLFRIFCVFVLFCLLFLRLYIAVSFLFLYKFTDHCHGWNPSCSKQIPLYDVLVMGTWIECVALQYLIVILNNVNVMLAIVQVHADTCNHPQFSVLINLHFTHTHKHTHTHIIYTAPVLLLCRVM